MTGIRALTISCALLGVTGADCATPQSAPVAPATQTAGHDRAALLASSELRYESSGGIAGTAGLAKITASNGSIVVEYRPADARPSTPANVGAMDEADYLALWHEVEEAGLWTLASRPPTPAGGDMIQYELVARVGTRSMRYAWTEPGSAPEEQKAGQIAKTILATVRRVTPSAQ